MAVAEMQEGTSNCANTLHTPVCVMSATVPLSKASHLVEPKVKGQVTWQRAWGCHGGDEELMLLVQSATAAQVNACVRTCSLWSYY